MFFNLDTISALLSAAVLKLIYALVVYIVGKWIINKLIGLLSKSKLTERPMTLSGTSC